MRYRVETRYGSVSYDESDREKAVALYESEGIAMYRCADLFDRGELIQGWAVRFVSQAAA